MYLVAVGIERRGVQEKKLKRFSGMRNRLAVWGKGSPSTWSRGWTGQRNGPQVQEEEICFVPVEFEVPRKYPRRVGKKV